MKITDEAVEAGAAALERMYKGPGEDPFHLMAKNVLEAALPHLSQGAPTAADILLKIALWSDDEGLELSMRQGDELARSIMSSLSSHDPAPAEKE